ncbi:MAG: transglutaminase domain-containing protein [Gammaproteobacteria bacterium]|nr:transglutaminase domain-containing protein [Gammaproteobacteria bacterium]
MRSGGSWFAWLIACLFALSILDSFKERAEQRQIIQKAEQFAPDASIKIEQMGEQFGVANATQGYYRFKTEDLWQKVAQIPAHRRHRFYMWSGNRQTEFIGSASGVDRNPYFANSFLVGFTPFQTDSVWEPLATLALRKSYVLDHKLYGPDMAEVWQNSRQAYAYSRGDCEDHALILADWLIGMGHDARVALGEYNGGGHAWVVLLYEGRDYILEATSKRRPRGINDFILASLATDYLPLYQFNRDQFWVNTGSKFTTRYRDQKWRLSANFIRNN